MCVCVWEGRERNKQQKWAFKRLYCAKHFDCSVLKINEKKNAAQQQRKYDWCRKSFVLNVLKSIALSLKNTEKRQKEIWHLKEKKIAN